MKKNEKIIWGIILVGIFIFNKYSGTYFSKTLFIIVFTCFVMFYLSRNTKSPKAIVASKEGIYISENYDKYMRGQLENFDEKNPGNYVLLPWDQLISWEAKINVESLGSLGNHTTYNVSLTIDGYKEVLIPSNSTYNKLFYKMRTYAFDKEKVAPGTYRKRMGQLSDEENFAIIISLIIIGISLVIGLPYIIPALSDFFNYCKSLF